MIFKIHSLIKLAAENTLILSLIFIYVRSVVVQQHIALLSKRHLADRSSWAQEGLLARMQPQVREQFVNGVKDFLARDCASRSCLTVLGLIKEGNLFLFLDLATLALEESFELQNTAVFHNDVDEEVRGARHIGFIPFKASQKSAFASAI